MNSRIYWDYAYTGQQAETTGGDNSTTFVEEDNIKRGDDVFFTNEEHAKTLSTELEDAITEEVYDQLHHFIQESRSNTKAQIDVLKEAIETSNRRGFAEIQGLKERFNDLEKKHNSLAVSVKNLEAGGDKILALQSIEKIGEELSNLRASDHGHTMNIRLARLHGIVIQARNRLLNS